MTASAKATAMAASTALPPRLRISTPARDASVLDEATIPWRARTGARAAASATPLSRVICHDGKAGAKRMTATRSSLTESCLAGIALFLINLTSLKNQLHVQRPLDRVEPIRINLAEAERAVERLRLAHRGERVEAHRCVAYRARLADDGGGEPAPRARAAELRADVEPLHLADAVARRTQGDAARDATVCARQQQTPRGRRVVAGQARKLLLEALKAEVCVERRLVLAEQAAHFLDLFGGVGLR